MGINGHIILYEDYVSFEVAKLLKEKGFPQDPDICNTVYKPEGEFCINAKSFWNPFCFAALNREYYMSPTLQMACKWLRVKYNIHIELVRKRDDYYRVKVNGVWLEDNDGFVVGFPEYVTDVAIKYCLEHLI